MSKNKSKRSKTTWVQRQLRDPYVRQAQQQGYRSRAVYKLREIDEKDRLLRKGMTVVDIGAAPGGWSQYVKQKIGNSGVVIAIDILPLSPIKGVDFIQGDFTEPETISALLEKIPKSGVPLVISDMAPNLTGNHESDQARMLTLAEELLNFSQLALRPNGNLLIKLFEGSMAQAFRQQVKEQFSECRVRKPAASRPHSRESYLLAKGYKND